MVEYWYEHRALRISAVVLLMLATIILIAPYLIPLGSNQADVLTGDLINDNGSFLNIEGKSIYVEDYDQAPEKEAVVLIHGFGGSSFSWRHSAPFFASQGYRVIALDMKGFGLSHKDFKSNYSHPAQARIIGDILDQLGIEQAYFVGHSMGTSVMFHFASIFPEKVLGMVSVNGALSPGNSSTYLSKLASFGPISRAGKVFLTHYLNKGRIQEVLESAYYNKENVSEEVLDGYYYRLVNGEWYNSLLAMIRDTDKNGISHPLEEFDFPTLIIIGENDSWINRADIEKWGDKLPSAEYRVIYGTGHMTMEEKPQLFNDKVLSFLKGVAATNSSDIK